MFMEVEMNRVRGLFGIALAVVMLASLPVKSLSQNPPATEKPSAEKTLTGQLVKVDTQTNMIAIRGADQKDMTFAYNESTQVISPDKTIQGLTGKAGAALKVTYREERGSNLATKIELMEK